MQYNRSATGDGSTNSGLDACPAGIDSKDDASTSKPSIFDLGDPSNTETPTPYNNISHESDGFTSAVVDQPHGLLPPKMQKSSSTIVSQQPGSEPTDDLRQRRLKHFSKTLQTTN